MFQKKKKHKKKRRLISGEKNGGKYHNHWIHINIMQHTKKKEEKEINE